MLANQPSQVTSTLGSGLYSSRMYEFGGFVQDDSEGRLQADC